MRRRGTRTKEDGPIAIVIVYYKVEFPARPNDERWNRQRSEEKELSAERSSATEPVEISRYLFQTSSGAAIENDRIEQVSYRPETQQIVDDQLSQIRSDPRFITKRSTTMRSYCGKRIHIRNRIKWLLLPRRSKRSRRYSSRNRTTFRGTQRLVSGRRAGVKDLMPTNDEVLCSRVDTN
ncbi:uncharacterized protein LOC122572906 [Bombus pyrosoma]|uniref:uncharacterized protein LOC122572906 n=1 Tax=Bombus pyrosoma TaxID=396416 RepID=UPI001CB943F7|nr:uncharacterized protein LOC122572906 [Bombus pyrosoma]